MPSVAMPNIGEGVTEGTVTRWLKAEGDAVVRDEPLVEVETDKAVVEIPSPFEGRLAKILVAENETVPVGSPLAEFEIADGEAAPTAAPATAAPATAAPEQAAPAQPPAAAPAAPMAAAPTPPGESVPAAAAAAAATDNASAEPAREAAARRHFYSPAVLRLAAEQSVDLSQVTGTGEGGRVTRKDVQAHLDASPAAGTAPAAPAAPAVAAASPVAPAGATTGAEDTGDATEDAADAVTPLSATRRSIAAHMSESHRTIPVAWMAVEADVTGLAALRERAKEAFREAEGVNLTYLPFFVQAIVAALKQHPQLNATYSEEGSEASVRVHRGFHVGLAVATDAGLLVPVIRDADRKSIAGLARQINGLGEKARERKLTVDEMRGATFTIDNTGAFGSLISVPIVPVGQVAIITTETIRRELRVTADGSFGARSVVNLATSFDHRALDGADVGRFMRTVKEHLEAYRPDQPVH